MREPGEAKGCQESARRDLCQVPVEFHLDADREGGHGRPGEARGAPGEIPVDVLFKSSSNLTGWELGEARGGQGEVWRSALLIVY